MRIAFVGAGALGTAYAALLAARADCEIAIATRRPVPAHSVRLERVDRDDVLEWSVPASTSVRDADVIVACVRYDQLDSVVASVSASTAPVVVLTPILPRDHEKLSASLGARLVVGMPSLISYRNELGVIRYWAPRMARTLVGARDSAGPEAALVGRMLRAGIAANLEAGVLELNVATTVSLAPIAIALDAAGGLEALLRDRELLTLAIEAAREGSALARVLGEPAPWASILLRFAGPTSMKIGLTLARSWLPEAIRYADAHFAHKLHAQNVAMGQSILELARAHRAKSRSLERLVNRVPSKSRA
jgi:2-dehydropantoate 2-reductase